MMVIIILRLYLTVLTSYLYGAITTIIDIIDYGRISNETNGYIKIVFDAIYCH